MNGSDEPAPAPAPAPERTLAAMWNKTPSTSTAGSSSSLPPAPASGQPQPEKAQPRKRRKKEEAAQGRLTFGANGLATAPPPPAEKKEGKRRKKDSGSAGAAAAAEIVDVDAPPVARKRKPKRDSDVIPLADDYSILSPDSEIVVMGSSPARLPSGSRATSPIPVDRAAPGPKKIAFAADARPAHSFFAKREKAVPEASAAPSASVAAATSSAAPVDKPAVHSFFNLAAREQGVLKKGWGCVREGDEPRAPWPGGEFPAHVEYAGVEYTGVEVFERRVEGGRERTTEQNGSTETTLRLIDTSPPTAPRLRNVHPMETLPFILQHPAIQAVLSTPLSEDKRESWAEAHRPRTAACVLGNEMEATYLRDWLNALSVGSTEARRVIRRVPRRKADPDTDWIVDDFYPEPFTDDAYEDLPEPEIEPEFPLGGRPDAYPAIDYWIGNALLLTGPTGCGKSAAVHAAAAELGWDVFEVYPGIGKRTGANLLALVGDVGKNHMVGEKVDRKEKKEKAKSFFGGAKKAAGSAADPVALDHTPVKEKPEPVEPAEPEKTKQSLILIDEADILYDEESTFWPAIVKLIADSHRPVVITCNDLSRIPRHSLPIHTTLYFLPPPQYLAQPYLAAIAARHGVQADIAALCEQCTRCPVNLVDQPLPPNGHEPGLEFDLRAAINQLQLDRGRAIDREEEEPDVFETLADAALEDMRRALEAASFADAYVAPASWELIDVYDIDHTAPGPDDEDGIHHLLKPESDIHPVVAGTSHASTIASSLFPFNHKLTALHLAQTQYIRHILPALDEVVSLECRLLPHATLFTETMPFLRLMVRTDDMILEADAAAIIAGEPRVHHVTGRAVRGAQKGYERRIVMGAVGLGVVRGGGVGWGQ